jgi:hypothetical protein
MTKFVTTKKRGRKERFEADKHWLNIEDNITCTHIAKQRLAKQVPAKTDS